MRIAAVCMEHKCDLQHERAPMSPVDGDVEVTDVTTWEIDLSWSYCPVWSEAHNDSIDTQDSDDGCDGTWEVVIR